HVHARPGQKDRSGGIDQAAGFRDRRLLQQHLAGENSSSRLRSGRREAALDQEFVEALAPYHPSFFRFFSPRIICIAAWAMASLSKPQIFLSSSWVPWGMKRSGTPRRRRLTPV